MRRFIIACLVSWSVWSCYAQQDSESEANSKPLRVIVNSPGAPPYLYYDPIKRQYDGMVVDFFAFWQLQTKRDLLYVDSSRAKSEKLIQYGQGDVLLSSADWVANPKNFLMSYAIVEHQSYLYAMSPFTSTFRLNELRGASICARSGYAYPSMQPLFESGQLLRVDASEQTSMIMMMSNRRCQYTILNNYSAALLFGLEQFCNAVFHRSPVMIHSTELVYLFPKDAHELRDQINQTIKHFIADGLLQQSMQSHSTRLLDGSQKSC